MQGELDVLPLEMAVEHRVKAVVADYTQLFQSDPPVSFRDAIRTMIAMAKQALQPLLDRDVRRVAAYLKCPALHCLVEQWADDLLRTDGSGASEAERTAGQVRVLKLC
jgi:hypothetical protein